MYIELYSSTKLSKIETNSFLNLKIVGDNLIKDTSDYGEREKK